MNQTALPAPAPATMADTDGTVIGQIHELDCGVVCALVDGGFMLDLDQIVDRGDLESLYRLLGQMLDRGAAASA